MERAHRENEVSIGEQTNTVRVIKGYNECSIFPMLLMTEPMLSCRSFKKLNSSAVSWATIPKNINLPVMTRRDKRRWYEREGKGGGVNTERTQRDGKVSTRREGKQRKAERKRA